MGRAVLLLLLTALVGCEIITDVDPLFGWLQAPREMRIDGNELSSHSSFKGADITTSTRTVVVEGQLGYGLEYSLLHGAWQKIHQFHTDTFRFDLPAGRYDTGDIRVRQFDVSGRVSDTLSNTRAVRVAG